MTTVTVTRDVVWASVDGLDLGLDLYRPDSEGTAPVVVYIHGGAWKEGDKSADGDTRLAGLAEHGIAVASINYRLIATAIWPAQIHDAKGAVRWIRAHGSEYGLATERIGVWGASAGAQLSALIALTPGDETFEGVTGGNERESSAAQVAVNWFGQVDLLTSGRRTWLEDIVLDGSVEPPLFGATAIADVAEAARAASPLHRITPGAPPFLVAHGDRDRLLPEADSRAFHDALSRAGVDSTYVILSGAGHEGHEFDSPAHLALTAAFLRAHL